MFNPDVVSMTFAPLGIGKGRSGVGEALRIAASLMSNCSMGVLADWVVLWVVEHPVSNAMETAPTVKILKILIIILSPTHLP